MFGIGLGLTIFGAVLVLAGILLPHFGDPSPAAREARVRDANVGDRTGLVAVFVGTALMAYASWSWSDWPPRVSDHDRPRLGRMTDERR